MVDKNDWAKFLAQNKEVGYEVNRKFIVNKEIAVLKDGTRVDLERLNEFNRSRKNKKYKIPHKKIITLPVEMAELENGEVVELTSPEKIFQRAQLVNQYNKPFMRKQALENLLLRYKDEDIGKKCVERFGGFNQEILVLHSLEIQEMVKEELNNIDVFYREVRRIHTLKSSIALKIKNKTVKKIHNYLDFLKLCIEGLGEVEKLFKQLKKERKNVEKYFNGNCKSS